MGCVGVGGGGSGGAVEGDGRGDVDLGGAEMGVLEEKGGPGCRGAFKCDDCFLFFYHTKVSQCPGTRKERSRETREWELPPSGSNVKDWILPQKEKKSVTCFSVTSLVNTRLHKY